MQIKELINQLEIEARRLRSFDDPSQGSLSLSAS